MEKKEKNKDIILSIIGIAIPVIYSCFIFGLCIYGIYLKFKNNIW